MASAPVHQTFRPVPALLAACLLGMAVLMACSGDEAHERIAAVKQHIAARLAQVLHVEVESIACPEASGPGFECIARVRGQDSFIIEVAAQGTAGHEPAPHGLAWRPRGQKSIEYQIARDLAERVRIQPLAVTCPSSDVARGLECQVTLPGNKTTTVSVAAGQEAASFVWTARDILMPAVIEERIQGELRDQGKEATVDCGSALRQSVPGTSFTCPVTITGQGKAELRVFVLDDQGHVQYELAGPAPAEAARAP